MSVLCEATQAEQGNQRNIRYLEGSAHVVCGNENRCAISTALLKYIAQCEESCQSTFRCHGGVPHGTAMA